VGDPCKAFDRISTQIGKLLALSPVNAPGRASNVATRKAQTPPYHLMHSMTWNEDGELDIR
jgi:hypothetical protein